MFIVSARNVFQELQVKRLYFHMKPSAWDLKLRICRVLTGLFSPNLTDSYPLMTITLTYERVKQNNN